MSHSNKLTREEQITSAQIKYYLLARFSTMVILPFRQEFSQEPSGKLLYNLLDLLLRYDSDCQYSISEDQSELQFILHPQAGALSNAVLLEEIQKKGFGPVRVEAKAFACEYQIPAIMLRRFTTISNAQWRAVPQYDN